MRAGDATLPGAMPVISRYCRREIWATMRDGGLRCFTFSRLFVFGPFRHRGAHSTPRITPASPDILGSRAPGKTRRMIAVVGLFLLLLAMRDDINTRSRHFGPSRAAAFLSRLCESIDAMIFLLR